MLKFSNPPTVVEIQSQSMPYKLAYKRTPQAEGRCQICMAHRPSTIVNPIREGPLSHTGHIGRSYMPVYTVIGPF